MDVILQLQKRSFSPTSDDGDLVVPPIADDDTPPPPERPLLRQPVAFAWDNSSSLTTAPPALNTYQASISVAPSSTSTFFLPGQEVPTLPLPAPTTKGSRTRKSGGTSVKKRRTTEYSGQTGRFRLSAYDPTPSTSPPLQHGQGPYSSMYRGTPSERADRASSIAPPTPTLPSLGGRYAGSVSSTSSAPDPSIRASASTRSSARRSKQTENRAKPPTGRAKSSDAKARPSSKARVSASTTNTSTPVPPVSSNYAPSPSRNAVSAASCNATSGGHYRHDYDGIPHLLDSPGTSAHSPFSEPRASNSSAATCQSGNSATMSPTVVNSAIGRIPTAMTNIYSSSLY